MFIYIYRTSGAVGIPILSEREYHHLYSRMYHCHLFLPRILNDRSKPVTFIRVGMEERY